MAEINEVICSCGAVNNETSKFCRECGALLKKPEETAQIPSPALDATSEQKPLNLAPADKHLKMIANTYQAVCGLPTGRGRYSEIVLYRDEEKGTYELHTYRGDGEGTEQHSGYEVDTDFAENIFNTIEKNHFHKLDEKKETPICGGMKVLKFVDRDGNYYRLNGGEGPIRKAFEMLNTMLYEGVCPERRIIPEYARKWKHLSVESKGMSNGDNYCFELERSIEGAIRISASAPAMGGMSVMQAGMMGGMSVMQAGMMGGMSAMQNGMMGVMTAPQKNWVELKAEESAAINAIPLGIQFSYVRPKQVPGFMNPMNGMGMGETSRKQCVIVYEDGCRDEKIVDDEMMSRLLEIIGKYL